jgi:hypothetical protein
MPLPMGNSIRSRGPVRRTTRRDDPSGLQSAAITLSMTSRGAPPPRGTRASIRVACPARRTLTASSPERDIPARVVSLRSSDRDSGLPGWVVKISGVLPSHRAS